MDTHVLVGAALTGGGSVDILVLVDSPLAGGGSVDIHVLFGTALAADGSSGIQSARAPSDFGPSTPGERR